MAESEGDADRLAHKYRERLKELGALHDTAQLLSDPTVATGDLLERIANRLPAAMQFVDDTVARVAWGPHAATSAGFATSASLLGRTFETTDGQSGCVEVGYRTEHPAEHEGPFLAEERALVDSIANMLRVELDRRSMRAAMMTGHANDAALAAESADLAVWEWLIDDDVVTWSPEMVRMFGDDRSGGRLGASSRIHPDDRERVLATVRAAASDGTRVFDLQFRYLRVDGSIGWLGARGRLVPPTANQPRRVRGVLADITRLKSLEDGVAQLQKMEAMGRVAAGVAHDFNNVLGVIVLNTGELLEILPTSTYPHQLAADIDDAAKRGIGLTQQLLQFSRKSELGLARLDPDVVIRRAEPMLRRIAGRDAALSFELGAASEVIADATQLDQIVMNLVVNARDALVDKPGTITVRSWTRTVGAELAGPLAAKPGRYAVISVADSGHGMSAETKARIFEPFFTTKPAGKGTGLGLAVVFGIVQQSQGFVTVESEPGMGAQFDVHLPAVTS